MPYAGLYHEEAEELSEKSDNDVMRGDSLSETFVNLPQRSTSAYLDRNCIYSWSGAEQDLLNM